MERSWVNQAINIIETDYKRSADTHLIRLPLEFNPNIQVYLKDESTHPTGSLKHRLARSLFLHALCNGQIKKGTTIIESSSGNTAVSEAYFSQLLGLPFIAVVPKSTAKEKIRQVEFYKGKCHLVEKPSQIYQVSKNLAKQLDGHYMDQFTNAEKVTDWRGNNNIAESIFEQMQNEQYPIPRWLVMTPGTGGTSATLGRYIRYMRHTTQLLVVDPEYSVFYDYYLNKDPSITLPRGSGIEGIGRPRVEPSFIPGVIDEMIKVPDAASVASMYWLSEKLGRRVGPSTGTNLWGVLSLVKRMHLAGEAGSIVTLLCDSGERYLNTYYNADWVARNIGDTSRFFSS